MATELKTFPSYIELQSKGTCNSNCTICPYSLTRSQYKKEILPDSLLQRILDECKDHKNEIKRIIPYMNNEPTLDSRYLNILRKLKENCHFVEFSTNASFLTKDDSTIIVKENLIDDLRISFFAGSRENYAKLMPGLNYDLVVKNIHDLSYINQQYGNPISITICVVLCPWIDMESEINLIHFMFPEIPIHMFGYLDRAENNIIKDNKLIEKIKNGNPLRGCELNRIDERMNICANGDVIICSQDWNREVIIGNVFESDIYSIWNSKKFQYIRDLVHGKINDIDNNFICLRCKLARVKWKNQQIVPNFCGNKYMSPDGKKLIKEIEKEE